MPRRPLGKPRVELLALLVALPSLRNGFVYDDVPAIVENPLLHSLSGSLRVWAVSYWPLGLLYRPVTAQLFALEWWIGGGAAWPFHLANALLYALVTLLVYRVAIRLLPQPGALAAAALFAVHPVHVEVFANAVGQSELLVALFGLAAVDRYLAWRPTGFSAGRRVSLALLCLLAIGAKETGYVVPLLLGLLEPGRRERREVTGGREVGAVYVLLVAVMVAGLLVRVLLFSSLTGETPTLPLRPFGLAERAVVMLAAVPQWVRLLLWPAHLQAHYGPPELPVTTTLGTAHVVGLLLLVAVAALVWWSWRRSRVVALGILWVGIALAPVSNVLTATGVIVAERTLFLPSVGLMLALGAGFAWLGQTAVRHSWSRALKWALVAVLVAGVLRSISRTSVWRSQDAFFAQLRRDAPRSYRAQFSAGSWYLAQRRFADAEPALAEAHALYREDPAVYETYGQLYRVQRRCDRALPIMSEGLALHQDATTLRSRLIECALAVGDSARARAVAAEAVALGQPEFQHTLDRLDRRAP